MMERKFYTDNFEKLLKENADQFKMYPSKNVWHGLYNDLHPGRRWPSITMSIIFLFSLVIVGHLNTGNNHRQHLANPETTKQTNDGSNLASNHPITRIKSSESNVDDPDEQNDIEFIQPLAENLKQTYPGLRIMDNGNHTGNTDNQSFVTNQSAEPNKSPAPSEQNKTTTLIESRPDQAKQNADQFKQIPIQSSVKNNQSTSNKEQAMVNNLPVTPATIEHVEKQVDETADILSQDGLEINTVAGSVEKNNKSVSPNAGDKKQGDKKTETSTVATSSSIIPKIKKENISWTYYISPSISYRNISVPPLSNTVVLNGPVNPTTSNNIKTRQYASIGMEAGASVNYKLFKKLQFVTGLQFNYTRYNITANNTHPTMASLFLNSDATGAPYSLSAISIYGNGTSTAQSAEVTLHNYSFQASVPLGLQYEIFGNDKIKLNAVATFQPSYMITNQSYILSSDKRNYLTDKDLLRTWNMNTNFGTYISFKTNTLNWQIGPQFRYQLLSTYTSNYPGKEHLVDYGVRVGVSKIFK